MAQTQRILDSDAFRQLQFASDDVELAFGGFSWRAGRTLFDEILDIIE
jgi:hypothetical protein